MRTATEPCVVPLSHSVSRPSSVSLPCVPRRIQAIYQRVLVLGYVDELLERVRGTFCDVLRGVAPEVRDDTFPSKGFTATFESIHAELEQRALEERKTKAASKPRAFTDSKKFANTRQGNKQSCAVGAKSAPGSATDGAADSPAAGVAEAEPTAAAEEATCSAGAGAGALTAEQIAANRAKLRAGGGPAGKKKGAKGFGGDDDAAPAKKGKEARTWDGEEKGVGKQQLDFSKKEDRGAPKSKIFQGKKVDLDERFGDLIDDENEDEEGTAVPAFGTAAAGVAKPAAAASSGGGRGIWASLKGLVGAKQLERDDLAPLIEQLQAQLVTKNVAADIGSQICESVCTSLLGTSQQGFGTMRATVRSALETALTRILTPSRRVDMLAAAAAAKAEGRPYVVCFVGVNGVGKSTSLSKVAYYLKSNGFTPMLCACDTFRAGAVEQLRVHANALELPLFEKGYGRDASGIAADGVKYAKQMGHDVVLIDTAGRMQDNEPLMRALSKLVTLNNPDLVLFVGEALVGNEAVDQVRGFNQSLSEYSASRDPRLIDGIMLTKFDTISDKVGAALSLVYTTGKPIVFVGVGQTYTDIRNLNVDHCVRSLLKS